MNGPKPIKKPEAQKPKQPVKPRRPLSAQTATTKKRITKAASNSVKRSAIGRKGLM